MNRTREEDNQANGRLEALRRRVNTKSDNHLQVVIKILRQKSSHKQTIAKYKSALWFKNKNFHFQHLKITVSTSESAPDKTGKPAETK